MSKNDAIEPREAEHIAKEIRAEHGLGQKYRLEVQSSQHGWHVRDQEGHVESIAPMPAERWREYLEERFVEAITAHDETSEA